MITIIDYGVGNIKSIQNMLRKIGARACISASLKDIEVAEKLILPGVGHFDHGMQNLRSSGLIEALNQKVMEEKVPFLGICLGAQLLGDQSEEGQEKGLGWIPMDIVRFDKNRMESHLKVPHMGWNKVNMHLINKEAHDVFLGLGADARFYFVHGYHMLPMHEENVLATTTYGYEFVSAVQQDNILGLQFHPEKSHAFGMQIMKNFASL